MKYFLIFLICIIPGCINSQEKRNLNQTVSEDFSSFYSRFYSDSTFQRERTLNPLEGKILSWDDNDVVREEFWTNLKGVVKVEPKEYFLKLVSEKVKSELIKKDTLVVERYWAENSGFEIIKKYILRSDKWYLYYYYFSYL